MKTQKNILIAFLLNLSFAIIEGFGGFLTGSIAILSDSVHDLGDALSIGVSYFLEKKSSKAPDDDYTYGYVRYSVLGGVITIAILLTGSVWVIISAIRRLFHPTAILYDRMIVLALAGCVLNLLAAWFTRGKDSINQKAVNLHMLEDVLGWIVVLVGAVVMRITDFSVLDPILSMAVALFILIHALKELKTVVELFLVKTPEDCSLQTLREQVTAVEGVLEVHHIHVWSMNGYDRFVTMHVVTDEDAKRIKPLVKEKLNTLGICHATLELEKSDEVCGERLCHGSETVSGEDHHDGF